MLFYENWRTFLNKPSALLIMEARVRDIIAKYPTLHTLGWLRYGRESIEATLGPKGVSKYLLWYGRELRRNFEQEIQQYEGDRDYGPPDWSGGGRPVAEVLLNLIFDFHAGQQRFEEKDIYKYNSSELQNKVEELGISKSAQLRAMKDEETAKKGSELIYNDHNIMAVRPLTTQASCYYGNNPRLTTWCISTKTSRNYFEQYTEEGKVFVITRFFGIPEGDRNHIVALQFMGGRLVAFWDAPNTPQDPDDLYSVVFQHLKGIQDKATADAMANFRDVEEQDEEEMQDMASEIVDELVTAGIRSFEEHAPPDPIEMMEKSCQEIEERAERELSHINVWYEIEEGEPDVAPWDDGAANKVWFGASINLNLPVETEVDDSEERPWSKMVNAFEERLRDVGIYALGYGVEVYPDEFGESMIIEADISAEDDPNDVDGFREFALVQCPEIDSKADDIIEILKNVMMERGYIKPPAGHLTQMKLPNINEGFNRRLRRDFSLVEAINGGIMKKESNKKIPEIILESDGIGVEIEDYFESNIVDEGPLETDQKDKLIFILSKALPNIDRGDLFNSSEEQLLDLLTKLKEREHGI